MRFAIDFFANLCYDQLKYTNIYSMAGEKRGFNPTANVQKAFERGAQGKEKPSVAVEKPKADKEAKELAAKARYLEGRAAERAAKLSAQDSAQKAEDAAAIEGIKKDLGVVENKPKVLAKWDGKVESKKDRLDRERANIKVQSEKWRAEAEKTRAQGKNVEVVPEAPKAPEMTYKEAWANYKDFRTKIEENAKKEGREVTDAENEEMFDVIESMNAIFRKENAAKVKTAEQGEPLPTAEQANVEPSAEAPSEVLAEEQKGKGMHRPERREPGGAYTAEGTSTSLPGMDAGKLGRAVAESRAREAAGENLDVEDVVVEKPSTWSKFKNLFKSSGQKQRELLSSQPMETAPIRPRTEAEEALSNTKGHRAESTSYSGSYDTAGTKSGIAGMDMTTSTGDKMRETQKLEDARVAEETRKFVESFSAEEKAPEGIPAAERESSLQRSGTREYAGPLDASGTRVEAPGMRMTKELGDKMRETQALDGARGMETLTESANRLAEEGLTDAWKDLAVELNSVDAVKKELVSSGVPEGIVKKYKTPAELSKFINEPGMWARINGDASATKKGLEKFVQMVQERKAAKKAETAVPDQLKKAA